MSDILGEAALAREILRETAQGILEGAGYERIETPAIEPAELFAGVPAFTLEGGLALRPEATAPICRAYAEHGMAERSQPVRLWYLTSVFRPDLPGLQEWQVGCEAIGSEDPSVDAEVVVLLHELLQTMGVADRRLRIGSRADLRADAAEREHFAAVLAMLDVASVPFELDAPESGLNYYSRTVFEFGSGLGRGGRHDGLAGLAGAGWAASVEGILAAGQRQPVAAPPLHLAVVWAGEEQRAEAFRIAVSARRTGHSVRLEDRLEPAENAGARYVAVVDAEGVQLKDMETGEQRPVEGDEVMHHIRQGLL